MKRLRANLTYSNVMVTVLAVLVIGGGSAYAATQMLPKNSVGSKQIKKEAVTPAKLSKASKAALTGPAGTKGETGATGAQGAQGERGPKGDTGESGHSGEPGPFPSVLPSGKSLSGYLEILSESTPLTTESASFAFPLAAPPTSHFIASGDSTPAGCTGDSTDPGAEPGNLCIFVISTINIGEMGETGPGGDDETDTRGFAVFARPAAAGVYNVDTRWVVTG